MNHRHVPPQCGLCQPFDVALKCELRMGVDIMCNGDRGYWGQKLLCLLSLLLLCQWQSQPLWLQPRVREVTVVVFRKYLLRTQRCLLLLLSLLLLLRLLLELPSLRILDAVLALKILDPFYAIAHAINPVPCRLLIVVLKGGRMLLLLLLLLLHSGGRLRQQGSFGGDDGALILLLQKLKSVGLFFCKGRLHHFYGIEIGSVQSVRVTELKGGWMFHSHGKAQKQGGG